jgi:uncharacterized membrane protein YgdD (TMEM256/DUF423 family)
MLTTTQAIVTAGGLVGAVGVALGAFGAHALRGQLDPGLFAVYLTGIQYHLVHALALVLTGVALPYARAPDRVRAAAWLFLFGVLVFSGSLYVLAMTGQRGWGAVTPAGGGALTLGWLALAAGMSRGAP